MRKFIFLFIFFVIITFSLAFRYRPVNNFPLFGKLIVLDPGHGSLDPGSSYKNEYEKTYNLNFSKRLKLELEKNGATVLMTREGDYDLSTPNSSHRKKSDFDNRIKLINESNADLYLSLHMNYLNDSSYYGSQVFYSKVNQKNITIAQTLQKSLNDYFNFNKGIKTIEDKYMFKNIKIAGVLIEYGFISSPKDRTNLKNDTYITELCEVIANSTINYFT